MGDGQGASNVDGILLRPTHRRLSRRHTYHKASYHKLFFAQKRVDFWEFQQSEVG